MKKNLSAPDLKRQEKLEAFDRLLTVMDELRENCPWDKKQTWSSLRHLTIEETYELVDAILENNSTEVKKELGDVLLHIVFYARIASEQNLFSIADVIHSLCDKLVERHPHVYGDAQADDEQTVKVNWEKIKLKSGNKSVLSGVPVSLPSVVKAMRIQEKARGAGFDWDKPEQVWEKVEEEIQELISEWKHVREKDMEKIKNELGDVFFSLINFARLAGINADEALESTNKKFIRRFQFMETESAKDGLTLSEMNVNQMETYWNRAKEHGL